MVINDTKWLEKYNLLLSYKEEFGNTMIKTRDSYKGIKLGSWVSEQRKKINNGTLSKDKLELLEAIGIDKNGNDAIWDLYYEMLVEYKETFGDVNVPKAYTASKDGKTYNLGRWLIGQREGYAHKGDRTITDEHIALLDELGISWVATTTIRNTSFNEAAIFYYVSKVYPSATKYHKDGIELDVYIPELNVAIEYDGSYWHSKEKDLEKNKYCKENGITLYRIREDGNEKLNDRISIDYYINPNDEKSLEKAIKKILASIVTVDITQDRQEIYLIYNSTILQVWKDKYAMCKAYCEEYGKIFTESYKTEDGINLGEWLHSQRKKYNAGKMPQEKIDLMDKLGVAWHF